MIVRYHRLSQRQRQIQINAESKADANIKSILNNQYRLLKNKEREGKTGPVEEWVPVGRGRVNEEGEEEQIRWMYVEHVYGNRTLKLTEIVLRRGRENEEGVNLIKIYCKYICTCHICKCIPCTTVIC
jgi:hypothetical protein